MENSIEEYVKDRIDEEGFLTSKNNNKKSKITKAVISVSAVLVTFVSIFFGCGKKQKKEEKIPVSTVHEVESTTNNLKINNEPTTIKKDNNSSKNNTIPSTTIENKSSKNSNKSTTTTQNNTTTKSSKESTTKQNDSFVVKPDSQEETIVYNDNNNIDYKIVNENGELVTYGSYGEGNSIDGYVYDENRKEFVRPEEAGKYIYSDITFYDSFGNIVINQGDLISIEVYESAKRELNYDEVNSLNNDDSDEMYYDGVLNEDGTYTVNDIIFESKEVYEYFLLNPEEFYMDENRIVRPISELAQKDNQKILK